MSISRIAKTIGESATLKLNQTAAILRDRGDPVIHLGGGEPESKAPSDAINSTIDLLKTGEVRYTPAGGTPAVKKAIIKYTEQYYGRPAGPENVMASGGAKQAIMCALCAILDPGDELIYPAPYWVSYPEMAKLTGAVGKPVRAGDGGFYPSLRDIERVVGPRTKAVMINSPNNPSGAMYSEEFIAQIVEFCEKRDLYLIMDDIYHRLVFDGRQPISSWKFARDKSENSKLVIINGVSKQYAMTGFRIGWAVANKKLISVMTNIQSHQTSGPSILGQVATVGAINGPQSSVDDLRRTLEENRNVMMQKLASFSGIRAQKPDGTFYCFVDFSKYNKDSTKLVGFLLEKVLVVTVPGVEFGMDGYLRLSTCGTAKDIREGIDRIRWALDPTSAKEIQIGDRRLVRDWM